MIIDRDLGLVTGETSSGKSTCIRRFTASLDPNRYFVIYLANLFLGHSGIYRDLLTALGHEPVFGRPKAVARIRSAFHEQLHTKHRLPLVILDEAHLLPVMVFEPLRLLFSADMDSRSLGILLLVGQPKLRRILRLSTHEAFYQRISTHYHLRPSTWLRPSPMSATTSNGPNTRPVPTSPMTPWRASTRIPKASRA